MYVPNDIVSDLDAFKNEFSTLLSPIRNLRHSTYVCRDYNIDLLKVKIKQTLL